MERRKRDFRDKGEGARVAPSNLKGASFNVVGAFCMETACPQAAGSQADARARRLHEMIRDRSGTIDGGLCIDSHQLFCCGDSTLGFIDQSLRNAGCRIRRSSNSPKHYWEGRVDADARER